LVAFASMGSHFNEAQFYPLYIVEVMKVFNKVYVLLSGSIAAIIAKTEGLITKLKAS
jgi:biotin carboxyl carrier protein